jgi:enoyl-CoA hydratase/carnithine racemase
MNIPKPTIAAVNGPATGLGADLAISCDFVMASSGAVFAWSYILREIIPDGGGMYFLPRRIGLSKAKELIFTGRKVDAQEALAMGIIDRISDPDELVSQSIAWAKELSRGSEVALALTKNIMNRSFETPAEQIFNMGSQAQGICYTTAEHHASVESFLARVPSKDVP